MLLFQKFSKSGTRVEEKGDVLVNEIADNIQKMLNDKVEAVKVRCGPSRGVCLLPCCKELLT